MLLKSLILFGFNQRPDVVAESSDTFLQFNLSLLVRKQIGELLRKLVKRLDEILNQDGQVRVLSGQVVIYERRLHLSEPVKHERPLASDLPEDRKTVLVVFGFKGVPKLAFSILVQCDYLF